MAEQASIEIGGKQVPVWVIGAGVLGGLALFLLTRLKGGGADSGALADTQIGEQFLRYGEQFQKALDEQSKALASATSQINTQFQAYQTQQAATNKSLLDAITALQAKIAGLISGGLTQHTEGSPVIYDPTIGEIVNATGGKVGSLADENRWLPIPQALPSSVKLTWLGSDRIKVDAPSATAIVQKNVSGIGFSTTYSKYLGAGGFINFPQDIQQGVLAAIHSMSPGFTGSYG